jgi:glycosyltransferase involved in cell wall biosynthesis
MDTVSIVTITQHSRFDSLQILYEMIQRQKYPHIKEWIIVEGSPSATLREENIKQIQTMTYENIRLIVPTEIIKLSDLRNLGNDASSGNIIVCMDDDDYYPSSYIYNIVCQFQKYNRLIAGCSSIYMYDFLKDKLYKCKGFHNNHSTNNCMAYRKEYLENHRYISGLTHAEECSFTNDFTESMIQLKPEIIVSIHDLNTVDKSNFISTNKLIVEIDNTITTMIPTDIFEKMKRVFIKKHLMHG